ncbi:L-tyrosine/L-tryptophan isonitrile synthase family protein [Micromonospora arida]|uniref:L-tyrosine/L-tryptophan isonitrile synthase family protein n=1 Tax=Micromonospora arida TaxID=2203715 RepID=UPI0033AB4277
MSSDGDLVFSADEPFGHQEYFSKIERAWQRAPRGCSLNRRRVDRYDAGSSLLYSPVEYEHRSFVSDLKSDPPDELWAREAFLSFVRGEFGTGRPVREKPPRFSPTIRDEHTVGLEVFERFLEVSEAELVYSSVISSISQRYSDDMTAALFEVLCHPPIGNARNRANVDFQRFGHQVNSQVERRDRLFLVLPSFPFKDQNRFRTSSNASTVDLGELALLVRLHVLGLALYQVHPFGADIVVLSDGLLYSDIFGVDRGQALKYREQLRGFRNVLNIQGTVSILDLSDLIGRLRDPATGDSTFDDTVRGLRLKIATFKSADPALKDAYQTLKRGMKWNLNTRESLRHRSDSEAWLILTEGDRRSIPPTLMSDWEAIEHRAEEAAEKYASTNIALRYHQLLERTFPGAIRATVHPKPQQFATPSRGSAYPWNGVAWVSGGQLYTNAVETRPLYDLARHEAVDVFRFDLTGEPLFFTEPLDGR